MQIEKRIEWKKSWGSINHFDDKIDTTQENNIFIDILQKKKKKNVSISCFYFIRIRTNDNKC